MKKYPNRKLTWILILIQSLQLNSEAPLLDVKVQDPGANEAIRQVRGALSQDLLRFPLQTPIVLPSQCGIVTPRESFLILILLLLAGDDCIVNQESLRCNWRTVTVR